MNRVFIAGLLSATFILAQDARQIMSEVQNRSQSKSQHYEGTLKVIDARNKIAEKRWEYDRLGSHGDSKAMLKFTAPAEVKGVALLILNHPDRASDQWMWIPANARERRIALQDRSTRFFGTDFSFEDLEERDVNQYDYKLLGEEPVDGAACWKIESRPRAGKASQYTSSVIWVRKDNYAPAKIDSFTKDKLIRQLHYSDIQNVQGIWTARKLEVFDVGRNSRTTLTLDKLQYNIPLKDESFTLQALRRQS
jgi:outer membrane lipoprotein-sorting protein